MSKKSLVDSIEVKTPCAEDWNAMKGNEMARFCSHCNLNVNNISAMTRKQALKLIRQSNGRLCVRYVKSPSGNQPVFADKLHKIARRAPRIAAATIAAALSLSAVSYAQGGVDFTGLLKKSDISPNQKAEKPTDKTAGVSGTITDQVGASIPNIGVTLTNAETNQSQTANSNDEGFYEFQNVSGGKYTVRADGASGFKTSVFEDLTVADGEHFKRDIMMEVGGEIFLSGAVFVVEYINPLHIAVSNDNAEEVKNLITGGADVNSRDENYHKITPLFLAVENGNAETAEILLNFGAKVNARDENKETPLMRLDADASSELVNLLISHGAKVNAADTEKNTPLMLAARSAKPEILEILLKHGAHINAQNGDGKSALMLAAEADNLENVRFLLSAGADANLKDEEGDTAYDFTNEAEIEKLLESYGAEIKNTSEESAPDVLPEIIKN